jgi:hypothetical protein
MPEQTRKLKALGTEIDVIDVKVISSEEPLNVYKLEDGTTVRIKNVLVSLTKVAGQKLPDGSPVYLVTTSPVVIPG